MVTSLIEHERIVTTTAKAKEVQSMAEKLITTAKNTNNPVHARRQINKIVRTDTMATKLMHVLGPRYQFREGGYTRILKLAKPRKGDNADMSVIEYVDRPGEIRAARPPASLQTMQDIQAVLTKLGLNDSSSSDTTAIATPGGANVTAKENDTASTSITS